MFTIVGVSTGLSQESTTTRLGDRLLSAAARGAAERDVDAQVQHINLRDLASALTNMTLTGIAGAELEAAFDAVRSADAVVTVTPVYKQAPIGIHTLFWQLIDDASLAGTATLIGSTGGTARHSLAVETSLRPMLAYLKAQVVSTSVFAATDDWGSAEGGASLNGRIDTAATELIDLALGGSDAARLDRMRDEFDPNQVTPFAALLGS